MCIRDSHYTMSEHVQQCVEKYLELSGKKLNDLTKVATPCIDDHAIGVDELEERGALSKVCSRIVLKALYVARYTRPDIYFAVNTLAREVTRWTIACDRRLHRLICYMHHTENHVQHCWVGDPPDKCIMALYVDAGFAGDLKDSKSSTGAMLCLMGPNTFVPMTWICKKQTAVSHLSLIHISEPTRP